MECHDFKSHNIMPTMNLNPACDPHMYSPCRLLIGYISTYVPMYDIGNLVVSSILFIYDHTYLMPLYMSDWISVKFLHIFRSLHFNVRLLTVPITVGSTSGRQGFPARPSDRSVVVGKHGAVEESSPTPSGSAVRRAAGSRRSGRF
jgi:hypothetical protein